MDRIGKLVTVLRDKCPECGSRLQVRQQESKYVGKRVFCVEEILCQTCGYSIPSKPEKRRRHRNEDDEFD